MCMKTENDSMTDTWLRQRSSIIWSLPLLLGRQKDKRTTHHPDQHDATGYTVGLVVLTVQTNSLNVLVLTQGTKKRKLSCRVTSWSNQIPPMFGKMASFKLTIWLPRDYCFSTQLWSCDYGELETESEVLTKKVDVFKLLVSNTWSGLSSVRLLKCIQLASSRLFNTLLKRQIT